MTVGISSHDGPHMPLEVALAKVQDDNSRLQRELSLARREADLLRCKLENVEASKALTRSDDGSVVTPLVRDPATACVASPSQVPVECLSESSNEELQCQVGAAGDEDAPRGVVRKMTKASTAQSDVRGGPGGPRNTSSTKARSRKRRDRRSSDVPGTTRYWSDSEHALFLEALKLYGHKDLKSISAYVGTRNMTQVRTHTQKYFMKLMREAKRRTASEEAVDFERDEVLQSDLATDVRSVPEACGVSLLSLVAQETHAQR